MPYIKLHPIKQLDFQMNRILTYGDEACCFEEVKKAAGEITDLKSWHTVWQKLAITAEDEKRFLHAAYYYRLAEFFLVEGSTKDEMYQKSIENYYKIINENKNVSLEYVPYQGKSLKTMIFHAENPIGTLVLFGGYDSFIEEFYLTIKDWAKIGYSVFLFEGPGQGETLKRGLTFEPYWEKPLGAVLDYFNLQNVCVIGISWGGYLALRSAAFDKRISQVVAYDALYDGFDCMTNPFPKPLKSAVNLLFALKAKTVFNFLVARLMRKQLILNWAVRHGQYITGTESPYEFYVHLKKHTLKNIMPDIHCDVLLLAGEHDHYIPASHFNILMSGITHAKSLSGKMFTQIEGGAEHCQVGDHRLAEEYIMNWLSGFYTVPHKPDTDLQKQVTPVE